MKREELKPKSSSLRAVRIVVLWTEPGRRRLRGLLEHSTREGDSPVAAAADHQGSSSESRTVWEYSTNMGGKLHLKLNIGGKSDSAQVP